MNRFINAKEAKELIQKNKKEEVNNNENYLDRIMLYIQQAISFNDSYLNLKMTPLEFEHKDEIRQELTNLGYVVDIYYSIKENLHRIIIDWRA